MRMPEVNVKKAILDLKPIEQRMVKSAFVKNRLRTTKPYSKPTNLVEASANYIWRWLAFSLCDEKPYVCIPSLVDIELLAELQKLDKKTAMDKWEKLKNKLDKIIDKVEKEIPTEKLLGNIAWLNTKIV